MSYFEFSDGVRVSLSKEEKEFLGSFETSVRLTEVNQKHLKVCLMLVNKSVLYRKKRNGELYYYKETRS
jgi:hypothetical protein|tara:strand:- start:16 stop:222 length:207 start_codon:yes stop_codon:yes gene_type:complete